MSNNKLEKFRFAQLNKVLSSGLQSDIDNFRKVMVIPSEGFKDLKTAFAWGHGLQLPLPESVLEQREPEIQKEADNFDKWFEESLRSQNKLNLLLLDAVAMSLCKKYLLTSEWLGTVRQLLIFPKNSSLITIPPAIAFKLSQDEVTEEYKVVPEPSRDATPSDFKTKEYADTFRSAKISVEIKKYLAENHVYQTLRKHSGRDRAPDPVLDLVPKPQQMWPWMETLHEVTGLISYFSDLDSNKYKRLISSLEKAWYKLFVKELEREKHLNSLQASYGKKVDHNELTPDQAQESYEKNIQALYEDNWQEEDKKIAGKVVGQATKELERLAKKVEIGIKKAATNANPRKRSKFA